MSCLHLLYRPSNEGLALAAAIGGSGAKAGLIPKLRHLVQRTGGGLLMNINI
jgi:hypothetical protein